MISCRSILGTAGFVVAVDVRVWDQGSCRGTQGNYTTVMRTPVRKQGGT